MIIIPATCSHSFHLWKVLIPSSYSSGDGVIYSNEYTQIFWCNDYAPEVIPTQEDYDRAAAILDKNCGPDHGGWVDYFDMGGKYSVGRDFGGAFECDLHG